MPSVQGSGTQTATVGEEHVLLDIADAGSYRLYVDTDGMQAGDVMELRAYLSLLSGSTPKPTAYALFNGEQETDELGKVGDRISNELASPGSALRYTLKQKAGTSRDFPWKVTKR